jgi:hypothetical protein
MSLSFKYPTILHFALPMMPHHTSMMLLHPSLLSSHRHACHSTTPITGSFNHHCPMQTLTTSSLKTAVAAICTGLAYHGYAVQVTTM